MQRCIRILARYQACHVTNQLKIFSIILKLSDQSKSQILNLLLVGEQQYNGGNFKLIGHLTSLIPCKDTLPCIQSLSADVALPPSEQMGQKITTLAHTKKEDVLDFP